MGYVESLNDLGGYMGLAALIEARNSGEDGVVALMATGACKVHQSDAFFDWTGFHGSCARTGEEQRVPEVAAFSGHIACATSTRSELVLLVRNDAGELIAVFDIDSDQPDAFTSQDAEVSADILATVFGRSAGVPAS